MCHHESELPVLARAITGLAWPWRLHRYWGRSLLYSRLEIEAEVGKGERGVEGEWRVLMTLRSDILGSCQASKHHCLTGKNLAGLCRSRTRLSLLQAIAQSSKL